MAIIPAEEKVFMVSNSTNTTYSGSAALKAMQQWYTMEDVTNTVRPYKVFTATVFQSGGSVSDDQNSGIVFEGTTYQIINNNNGDFSNVGAPNNNVGTYFIATSNATPNSYGGAALAFNTGAPAAIILENTIGNVYFEFEADGRYIVRLENAPSSKIFIPVEFTYSTTGPYGDKNIFTYVESNNLITIITKVTSTGLQENDLLYKLPLEIRVYN